MLFRLFYALIYSLLLVSLSGFFSTALAVVSCQDPIVTGSVYKYSNALSLFTEYNGKTYAISKSAISGSQSLPDSYFSLSADISREYLMTGVDTVSLKRMLSLGRFGAARPVTIDSRQTLDFLLSRYGKYLDAASSTRSSYVDAWKEFGTAGFTTFDGSGLAFTNWPGAGPYSGQDPQAVVMGSDGLWMSGIDGPRSSQLVEFSGKLDCAVSFVTPGSVTDPPQPPAPPILDPNAISNVMCGQDLNNNGYAADPGEVSNCIQTPQGQYCPVGSTDCVETLSQAICPNGSTLETDRDMCQATAQTVCGSGYVWDAVIDKCIMSVTCPEGGTFNTITGRCEKQVLNDCPSGYTYDNNSGSPTFDRCIKPATCNGGGLFIEARDRCENAWVPECNTANGYSYNAQNGKCERSPLCSSGVYNTSLNLCMKSAQPECPSGYSYNTTGTRCEMAPVCPTGTNFNSITNRCEVAATIITGYARPNVGTNEIIKYKGRGDTRTGIDQFTTTPTALDSFSFDFIMQDGQVMLKQECAWGGAGNCGCDRPHWNGWCRSGTELSQTRSGNTLTVMANIFDLNPYSCCSDGYHLLTGTDPDGYLYEFCQTDKGFLDTCYTDEGVSYRCWDNPTVSVSTCYSKDYIDGAAASADLSEFAPCPAGYTPTTAPAASQCITILTLWGNQTGISDCSQAGLYTCAAQVNACYTGYFFDGSLCYQNPTCPSGTFDYGTHLCFAPIDTECGDGFSLDSATNLCIKAPACPLGTLNPATDLCEAIATKDCGAYTLDAPSDICYSSPVCESGAYDSNLDTCLSTLTRNCGSYSWSQTDFKCIQSVTCPQDPGFSEAATTSFSADLGKCVSTAEHNCPTGTTYTPLPIGKCEAKPICSGAGIYSPQKDSCFEGLNTCPLGTQYTCMDYSGQMRCSPNPCFDPSSSGAEVTAPLDESMLQDDAPRDSDGKCLGQLYIFNGKASRCRPPGLRVGYLNNCCESDKIASEDTGNNTQYMSQGIQTAYEIGQVAYYGEALASGAAEISAISTTASGAVTSMTVVTAGGATSTLSGATASGAYASLASGTTGVSAITAGLEEYIGALLNPTTIILAIVVLVVMKVLMGKGCDQGDIQTGLLAAAKNCHYLGDFCEKKWVVVGCVQKAKSYCCFNSKMARIIHEQGRPQLHAFQPNGAWGTPAVPNCRGFSPDEFQALDFSKIDLTEYFEDIQKDLATKIQGSQQTIMENIQNRNQATQK